MAPHSAIDDVDAATLNKMLVSCIRERAARRPESNAKARSARSAADAQTLARSLGLDPQPPKSELRAQVTGVLSREGYRVERIRYESLPGVFVAAHLYIPEGKGPFPLVLHPHGHWTHKKSTPFVQARAIGMAVLGFAGLVVESPGRSWDENECNERAGMGSHDDPALVMGWPVTGQYVWDLVRGLDYCQSRSDIDWTQVGITGASGGGLAAAAAFAYDRRIGAAAIVCFASSLESNPHNGCLCHHLPGITRLGDRSDLLAIRAPAPILLISATEDEEFPLVGHQKTFQKLQRVYETLGKKEAVRLEVVEGRHDYSRRMREAMYAFFAEHLVGAPRSPYLPEPRPMTDGAHNPYERGTEPATSPDLWVTPPSLRQTRTLREVLADRLSDPRPEPFDAAERLIPWGRHGKIALEIPSDELTICDEGFSPRPEGAFVLPSQGIDFRLCVYLGISGAEFLAQLLHLGLPGGPAGWEPSALGGDPVSAVLASLRTLSSGGAPEKTVSSVRALGPVSSRVARHLRLLRPGLKIETSHFETGWLDSVDAEDLPLIQPGARYLEWPFGGSNLS